MVSFLILALGQRASEEVSEAKQALLSLHRVDLPSLLFPAPMGVWVGRGGGLCCLHLHWSVLLSLGFFQA